MKINATVATEVTLSDDEVQTVALRVIFQKIFELMGVKEYDDAGLDWITDPRPNNYNVYIDNRMWHVIDSQEVHTLVDAANLLHHGALLHVE